MAGKTLFVFNHKRLSAIIHAIPILQKNLLNCLVCRECSHYSVWKHESRSCKLLALLYFNCRFSLAIIGPNVRCIGLPCRLRTWMYVRTWWFERISFEQSLSEESSIADVFDETGALPLSTLILYNTNRLIDSACCGLIMAPRASCSRSGEGWVGCLTVVSCAYLGHSNKNSYSIADIPSRKWREARWWAIGYLSSAQADHSKITMWPWA